MAETHYSLNRDLDEARAMVEGLDDYVQGDRLYGSVEGAGMYSADSTMPSLTIGGLLLRLHRLHKLEGQMSPEQKAILTIIETEHERVRKEWSVHYLQKLANEAGARLHSLEAFFAECEDDPEGCAGAYLPEAQRRTILQDIVDALSEYHMPDSGLDHSLKSHDVQLRRLTEPTDFIWDAKLQTVYPREKYWWLYVEPTGETEEQEVE